MLQNNQGLLGGNNLIQGGANFSGFGSGGLPHSSLMAYPPPLTSNSTNTNSSGGVTEGQHVTVNAGGFPNRS